MRLMRSESHAFGLYAGVASLACLAAVIAAAQTAAMGDPVIEAARKSAAAYGLSLPDYIVKRTTTRYAGARSNRVSAEAVAFWRQLDVVTADVAAEHGKEVYTNITVNAQPSGVLPRGGAWSMGEFSTELVAVLSPERSARFTHQRTEPIRNRAAYRYEFAVGQAHSSWNLAAEHLSNMAGGARVSYSPAYSGAIWIDKETGQSLRIEMYARDLPQTFPLDAIESDSDYDFVKIGEAQYVLPIHSVSLTCERGTALCLKNETIFRDYDKFGASTTITFDAGAK